MFRDSKDRSTYFIPYIEKGECRIKLGIRLKTLERQVKLKKKKTKYIYNRKKLKLNYLLFHENDPARFFLTRATLEREEERKKRKRGCDLRASVIGNVPSTWRRDDTSSLIRCVADRSSRH